MRRILVFIVVGLVTFRCGADSSKVKNVIFLIGDGMGPQQVGLLVHYAHNAPNSPYADRQSAMEKMMADSVLGVAYHEASDVLVADSAASATQFASGVRSGSEMIGLDRDGEAAETILGKAKRMGKSTGLVSDTRLTHATPAAFAARQTHRSKENEIAVDMLGEGVDVMLSGGLRHWIPKEANDSGSEISRKLREMAGPGLAIKSKRKDGRNLLEEAKGDGYALAFNRSQLEGVGDGKVLGLFSDSGMPNGILHSRTKDDPDRTVPSLKEMTAKALEILSKNESGFFLLVEAGRIDWAGHDNDAGTMLHEMLKFDETIRYVRDWVGERDDTLVIISADHETGGFGFSYSRRNIPEPRDLPGEFFEGEKFAPRFNFGSHEILDKLYDQKLSYPDIFSKFEALPKEEQTPATLKKLVGEYTEFPITLEEAEAVLAREENQYYVQGHPYLDSKTLPKVDDFEEFYVYGEDIRYNLLGRVSGKYQNVVWATGTHTATPVYVVAYGPPSVAAKFGRVMHTTEWARLAMDSFADR